MVVPVVIDVYDVRVSCFCLRFEDLELAEKFDVAEVKARILSCCW